jgi:hypothetical protein
MEHRHLIGSGLSLAAIDDVIARGLRADWRDLRDQADRDHAVRQRIIRVCAPRLSDPYAQRHHLWNAYVRSCPT